MQPDNDIKLEIDTSSAAPALRLAVKVVPGARRERIVGPHGGALKVMIAQPPEKGAANRALCRLLADSLAVPARQVQVISGHSSPWKTVRIEGVTPQQARRRLLAGK